MSDQVKPTFIDADSPPIARPVQSTPQSMPRVDRLRIAERRRLFTATLDTYLIVVVVMLLAIGLMMVYSTTFDWAYQDFGSEGAIFFQQARNMAFGGVILLVLALIDYRIWKRLAPWLLLAVIGVLVAVLQFGDETFGARRALINGSLQPGELAELVMIIYMAAWLGSKKTKVRSITYGLIPFSVLVGIVGGLILLQPDLSTAAIVFITCITMFFLAGADVRQLGVGAAFAAGIGWFMSQRLGYAQERVTSYLAGITDLTQANYHVQQAVIAFLNGGWTGVGLGQGRQKFGFLPAPHTDSIFAVIGEELGILGAALVVALFVALVIRGFQTSRRAVDSFGALLAAGITIWVISQALLNIAVMAAVVPSTGVPLPFISFGGSSLVVSLSGIGLLLSVSRVTARQDASERRSTSADYDLSRGDRRPRVSGTGRSRSNGQRTSGR